MTSTTTDAASSPGSPTLSEGFRLVWRLVSPHLVPFGLAVLGAAVYASGTVFSAQALGWVVDTLLLDDRNAAPTTGDIGVGVLALGGTSLLVVVGVIARRWFAGMTAERVERTIRTSLGEQYVEQPLTWLRDQPTGRLLGHIDSDSRVLIESLHPLPFAGGVVVLVVVSSIQLFRIDIWIALLALVLFPIMIVTNRIYSSLVEKPLAHTQEVYGHVAGTAHESFTGALVVKTLGRREVEVERFDAQAQELRAARQHTATLRAYVDAVLSSLPQLGTLVVVLIGSWRVSRGAMSAGDIVTVAALFSAMAIPMLVFGFLLESLVPSVVAWRRLGPVVGMALPEQSQATGHAEPGAADLAATSLTHRWAAEGEPVLDDIDLHVGAGDLVAIVGSTGSGKTTLCEIIAGLREPTAGTVTIGGIALTDLSSTERAGTVGLVPQQAWLYSGTIRSNVDPAETSDDTAVLHALQLAAIDDWVTEQPAGLDTIVGERGVTLSGGQRQRIALARNLLAPPQLLILDDVTSAVDTLLEQQILQSLRQLETTVILVANRPSTLQLVRQVIHLREGRIVNMAAHTELLEDPTYAETVAAYGD